MSVSGSTSSSISITGTLGGVSISAIISSLDAVNREPATVLQSQQTTINSQTSALTDVQSSINNLLSSVQALSSPSFWRSKAATLSDPTVGTATVDSLTAAAGSYDINILQTATQSVYTGSKATTIPAGSATVESVFGTGADGVFTIGTAGGGTTQITVIPTTTLDGITVAMQAALGAGSSVSYSAATGKFTVSAGDSLILASNTSSFLQDAQIFNGYSARSSATAATFNTASSTTMAGYFGGSFVPGSFSLNGTSINVNATDTISDVINRINAQASGVTASVVSGRLTINSSAPITVANGTGSFFNQAGLATSSSTSSTSSNAIGLIADLNTAMGGSDGAVTINGTTVNYAATDSLATVLQNITNSDAGVTASYDTFTDQIVLTAKASGPDSIAVSGVTGNLASYGLGSGSLNVGKSTIYTVNGGAQRVAASNVLDESDLGIAGVSFTANKVGDTAVTIGADVANIQKVLNAFVDQYNSTQNVISSFTGYTTTSNSDGSTSVTAGALANDMTVVTLPQQLRLIFGGLLNPSGTIQTLAELGITGNSTNNTATESDTNSLTSALTSHLSDVITMFTDSTTGVYSQLNNIITNVAVGSNSILGTEISNNNSQIKQLNTQIAQINEQADLKKSQLEQEYANYESAYQTAQSTMQYFNSSSGSSSSSSSSNSNAGGILG